MKDLALALLALSGPANALAVSTPPEPAAQIHVLTFEASASVGGTDDLVVRGPYTGD